MSTAFVAQAINTVRCIVRFSDNSNCYAPNFGKVEGAYCFGRDRPSARSCVRSKKF